MAQQELNLDHGTGDRTQPARKPWVAPVLVMSSVEDVTRTQAKDNDDGPSGGLDS